MPRGALARLVGRRLRWRYLGDGSDDWATAHPQRGVGHVVAPADQLVFQPEVQALEQRPGPPELDSPPGLEQPHGPPGHHSLPGLERRTIT